MTTQKMTAEEQLDAAWQARVPARLHVGRLLKDLADEVTQQQQRSLGGWSTDLDGILSLARQAHTAQVEMDRITKQIAELQEILRAQ